MASAEATAPPVGTPQRPLGAVRRFWAEIQWPVVSLAAVTSIVLGYIGWAQQLTAAGIPKTAIDPLYLSIQLFTLQVSGVPDANGFPLALQIARFLAPAVAGYAAVSVFMTAFRQTRQKLSVRFASDHVVICGLGATGLRLAQHLRAKRIPVVAVDPDTDALALAAAREAGIWVIEGDARDTELLGNLRLDRASHLVACCGDDATNGEVALAVADVVADRHGPELDCRVHVGDAGLSARLRTREVAAAPTPGMNLDYFSLHEAGARTMFSRFPPFGVDGDGGVVVVGGGAFAQATLVELARLWSVAGRSETLPVRLVAAEGENDAETIQRRLPGLLERFDLSIEHLPTRAATLPDVLGRSPNATVYVCLANEVDGLAAALALADAREECEAPVVVRTNRDRGLAELMAGRREGAGIGLAAFGLLDAACDPDVLLGGLWDQLAVAIHEAYVVKGLARGETRADNPALVPWSELPESLRRANRSQARDVGVKLAAIGARPVPLVAVADARSRLTDDEIERLAELEHDRWSDDRRADGWTLGTKDHQAKTTPYLVGWDVLDEDVRELDRNAVRELPRLLALTGHCIGR
ncbi:MAG: NAD-binding protein [Microthrixaceae bacterium]